MVPAGGKEVSGDGGAAMTAEEQMIVVMAINEAAPYLVFTIALIVGAIIAR